MLSTFCLALVVYVEARGEPIDGQLLVAEVVLNRVQMERYPDDVCSVVFDYKQFSGITDHIDLYSVFNDPAWSTSRSVARDALAGNLMGLDATHFHADYSKPHWSNHLTKLGKVGRHIFYKEQ